VMRNGENRVTTLQNGYDSIDVFLSQNRTEANEPMLVLQVYTPEYEATGNFSSFWLEKDEARALFNHLRAFLATP
jgi:hypothetical protein